MADFIAYFIKDYGEVIVVIEVIAICIGAIATGIIAFMTWRALKAWKKQNKIAKAEAYVKLLWQLRDAATDNLEIALRDDILDDFHLKPAKAKERTYLISTLDDLRSFQLQLLLIGKIFPKIAENMSQLENDIILMMAQTYALQKQIRDKLRVSQAEDSAKKSQAYKQVEAFFADDNELIKRIKNTHNAMHYYLEKYVVEGLQE